MQKVEDPQQQATGNLNAMNYYFHIRLFAPAVPIYQDREYARCPFHLKLQNIIWIFVEFSQFHFLLSWDIMYQTIWAQEADVFPEIKLVLLCRIFVYNNKTN